MLVIGAATPEKWKKLFFLFIFMVSLSLAEAYQKNKRKKGVILKKGAIENLIDNKIKQYMADNLIEQIDRRIELFLGGIENLIDEKIEQYMKSSYPLEKAQKISWDIKKNQEGDALLMANLEHLVHNKVTSVSATEAPQDEVDSKASTDLAKKKELVFQELKKKYSLNVVKKEFTLYAKGTDIAGQMLSKNDKALDMLRRAFVANNIFGVSGDGNYLENIIEAHDKCQENIRRSIFEKELEAGSYHELEQEGKGCIVLALTEQIMYSAVDYITGPEAAPLLRQGSNSHPKSIEHEYFAVDIPSGALQHKVMCHNSKKLFIECFDETADKPIVDKIKLLVHNLAKEKYRIAFNFAVHLRERKIKLVAFTSGTTSRNVETDLQYLQVTKDTVKAMVVVIEKAHLMLILNSTMDKLTEDLNSDAQYAEDTKNLLKHHVKMFVTLIHHAATLTAAKGTEEQKQASDTLLDSLDIGEEEIPDEGKFEMFANFLKLIFDNEGIRKDIVNRIKSVVKSARSKVSLKKQLGKVALPVAKAALVATTVAVCNPAFLFTTAIATTGATIGICAAFASINVALPYFTNYLSRRSAAIKKRKEEKSTIYSSGEGVIDAVTLHNLAKDSRSTFFTDFFAAVITFAVNLPINI